MLNKVCISGRMGKNPELRHTQSGTAVLSISLACDRDFRDKQTGERKTDWIDVVIWGATAEYVSRFGEKGRSLIVSGRLQNRDWIDKEGNKHRSTEIVAESVYFCDSKREKEDTSTSGFEDMEDDEEIPF